MRRSSRATGAAGPRERHALTTPSEQAGDAPRSRFVVLDGLRGVAALSVVTCHVAALTGYPFVNAPMAVDFFFVLSGFVLAHAYGDRLAAGLSPARFMVLRLIRLYPLYALGLGLGLLSVVTNLVRPADDVSGDLLAWAVPLGLFMAPVLAGTVNFPLNGPAWSLFFEMVASALFGVFHRLVRWPMLMASGLLVSAAALCFMVLWYDSIDLGWQTDRAMLGGLARVGFSFLAGVAVYRLRLRRAAPLRLPAGVLAAGLLAVLILPRIPWLEVYQLACIILVFPVIVYLGAEASSGRRMAGVLTVLGAISYPVYAIHWPLYHLVDRGVARAFGIELSGFAPWSGLAFVSLAAVAAWLAHRVFDSPVRRALTRRVNA